MTKKIVNSTGHSRAKDGLIRFQDDLFFLDDHHEEFVKKYPDQWLAVYNNQVVGVNDDFDTLLEDLRSKGISPGETAIELMSTERVTWVLYERCN